MAIKIEMLRCFSTVAETGNLSEAAERLGRTQSAISMTLKQLEEHLGERLFESDRKNRLTMLGEQVFELARTELLQFDDTVRAIETSASAPQGLLRVASVPSVAGMLFPPVVRAFTTRFPGIRLELRDTDSGQVVNLLTRGQADVGIASARPALNGIRQMPLFSDRFGLVCAPDHVLAQQQKTLTIDDVFSANFISNELCQTIDAPDFQRAVTGAKLTVRNTLSLISMVRSGNWVTILPKTVVSISPSEVVFREVAGLSQRREVCLFLREKTPFLRYAEELVKIIVKSGPGGETSADDGDNGGP